MRKTFAFASAVLLLTALSGCQTREIFNDDSYVPERGDILFRLGNGSGATKASDASSIQGLTIDLGTVAGSNFHLDESISYVDDMMTSSPETKGTPAYTENFNALYGGFNAAAYRKGETTIYDDGAYTLVDAARNLYKKKYDNNLWDKQGLYFFSRTPVDITDNTNIVSGLAYNTTNGSIKFHYNGATLTKAEDQKDILFTSRQVSDSTEYQNLISQSKGIPILFHHALTGVKFAIANYEAGLITIDSVYFRGLYDSGECIITPEKENGGYVDIADNYSSARTTKWTADSLKASSTAYYAAFTDTVYYAPGGNFGSEDNKYPASFSNAGNKHNLNDAAATKTFWFVPQSLARTTGTHVTLTIVYKSGGVKDRWTLDLSDIISSTEWKAGELRTYTIRIDDVNVKIDDRVTMAAASSQVIPDPVDSTKTHRATSYKGSVKDSVIIKNTGNTDAFIRAALIGQWLDEEGNPVFGFTDYTAGKVILVDSWYKDQFVNTVAGKHGTFVGLPGYKGGDNPVNGSEWILCTDGYYYYKQPVAPGDTTATRLFQTYTVGDSPAVAVAGKVKNVIFQLEIATQAISAKTINGSDYAWDDAWENALGSANKPVKK